MEELSIIELIELEKYCMAKAEMLQSKFMIDYAKEYEKWTVGNKKIKDKSFNERLNRYCDYFDFAYKCEDELEKRIKEL